MEPEVVPLRGGTVHFPDSRGPDRLLRTSWHGEQLVVSLWREGTCVGTTRLTRGEAARLLGSLATGLAENDSAEPASDAGRGALP